MNERPKSITVVCWILIIMSGISLVRSIFNFNNSMTQELMSKSPIPISIQYIIMFTGLLITLACGIAMLKGQNWARLLYVGWSIIGFIIGITTSPMKVMMIPGIIIFFIFTLFLFHPKANEYFKATEVEIIWTANKTAVSKFTSIGTASDLDLRSVVSALMGKGGSRDDLILSTNKTSLSSVRKAWCETTPIYLDTKGGGIIVLFEKVDDVTCKKKGLKFLGTINAKDYTAALCAAHGIDGSNVFV